MPHLQRSFHLPRSSIITPDSINISVAFKLEFLCSNNEAEYEALVIGLTSALRRGIQKLEVQGDLKLIIKQVNGDFTLKEISHIPYRTTVQRLVRSFDSVQFQLMPREHNRHADALAIIASKIDAPEGDTDVSIIKRTILPTTTQLIPANITDEQN